MAPAASTRLRDSIKSTEEEAASVEDALRDALRSNSIKIMDLFVEWDENGDHQVSKSEFRKAMAALGFTHSRPHIDSVFDSLDEDGSGFIDYKELNRGLKRHGKAASGGKKGSAAAPGSSEAATGADANGGNEGGGDALQGDGGAEQLPAAEEDRSPEALLQKRLRDGLQKHASRIIDLFDEWDENGDGLVTPSEFMRALPLLGLSVDKQTCDRLFQTFDPDGSGEITLIELQASLKAMAPTQTGAGKADAKASKKKSKPAKTKPRGPTVDTALVKALAETEPEVHDNDDDDDGDEPKQFKGASVVARLREALARVGTRVVDVFKQWDYNGDGQISREEFNMAMPLLGVRASPAELEQLFAIFDPDRSGTVDYRELNAQLRHITATGAHTKPLTSLAYRAKNRYAPRKLAHVPSSASVEELIKAEIEDAKRASTWFSKPEQSNKNAIAALRGKLSENASSAIDLLRQWDQDGSGAVSRDEFQNAIKFLGIKCSAADIDGLFEEMDTDRSGELSLREINRDLRRGAAGEVAMILPSSATKDADASRVEDAGGDPKAVAAPSSKARSAAALHRASLKASKQHTTAAAERARVRHQKQRGEQPLSLAKRAATSTSESPSSSSMHHQQASESYAPGSVLSLLGVADTVGPREGGRYYPRASDRLVPSWGLADGAESPAAEGADRGAAPASASATLVDVSDRAAKRVSPPKPALPLPVAIDAYSEELLQAPTIPIAQGSNLGASASMNAVPAMFAADLEGPAQPEVQKWEWTFNHIYRKKTEPLRLHVADTVLLSPTTELMCWLFTTKDGCVKRKNADKLTPSTVCDAFERAAAQFGAFNTQNLTTVARRSGAGASILDEAAMRDLTKDSGDLSGIVALQLYVHSKGGNATRYVCEYALDRARSFVRTTVHKRVYLGADGLTPHVSGARGSEKKPVAHHVNCGVRWLNDKLCQATRDLVLRLEMHSRQTVLHYNAEFILDENEVPWFVGGKDVVTQRMPAVPPPKQGAEKHVAVNPTLQARTGLCMGDYCCLDLRKLAGLHSNRKSSRKLLRRGEEEVVRGLQPIDGGGGSLGDLVNLRDGSIKTLTDLKPTESTQRSLLPALRAEGDGVDQIGGEETQGAQENLAVGVDAALQEVHKSTPTHRVPYRTILLDRALRARGVKENDPAPPGLLQEFEAKTRRRLELYYKPAHVCAVCANWYERQSRFRAAELDAHNSPLTPLVEPLKSIPSLRAIAHGSDADGDATSPLARASAKAAGGGSPSPLMPTRARSTAFLSGEAPASLARAMMRTSTSLPMLSKSSPPPIPRPSKRTGPSRLLGVQVPSVTPTKTRGMAVNP